MLVYVCMHVCVRVNVCEFVGEMKLYSEQWIHQGCTVQKICWHVLRIIKLLDDVHVCVCVVNYVCVCHS